MSLLWESGSIGNMRVGTRVVRGATWENMAGEDGEVTEELVYVYKNLAEHDIALMITGYAFVTKKGRTTAGTLGADRDEQLPGLKKLTEAVHEKGGRVVLQINHGGSQSQSDPGKPTEAPSAIRERVTGNMPVEMTEDDICRVVEEFGQAARRAKEAYFDAVEVHAAHGYLVSQFLSPYSNRRGDRYGGSIENRGRILFEIYESMRGRVGQDFPVMAKVNVSDFDGVGLSSEDSLWICKRLSQMGIDAIELSGGVPAAGELSPARLGIDRREKEAYFREYAREFSPHLRCPILLIGGLRSLEVMEEIFQEGSAQFFSLCRPFVSEPGLIKRWRSGDTRRSRCISCNKCLETAFEGSALYCVAFSDVPIDPILPVDRG